MDLRFIRGEMAVLAAALIWGFAFAAQKSGAEALPPAVFVTVRLFIGAVCLIPVILGADRIVGRRVSVWGGAGTAAERNRLLLGGGLCGTALTVASVLQQAGLAGASAGKAGFLTSLYMILVPVLGWFCGRRTRGGMWLVVLLALAGMWLLSAPGASGALNGCDLLLIACAAVFALHILAIDRFAPLTDCLRLSCLQFFSGGVMALAWSLAMGERWEWAALRQGGAALLYCGVASNGIAYTLQIAGQKHLHPVVATLIMSLESVFAVLGGWLVLGERLSGRELAGCAVIFAAVLLVQLPRKSGGKE